MPASIPQASATPAPTRRRATSDWQGRMAPHGGLRGQQGGGGRRGNRPRARWAPAPEPIATRLGRRIGRAGNNVAAGWAARRRRRGGRAAARVAGASDDGATPRRGRVRTDAAVARPARPPDRLSAYQAGATPSRRPLPRDAAQPLTPPDRFLANFTTFSAISFPLDSKQASVTWENAEAIHLLACFRGRNSVNHGEIGQKSEKCRQEQLPTPPPGADSRRRHHHSGG